MTPVSRQAVFLDRDGVLNRSIVRAGKPYPPDSVEELEVLPGVPEGLSRLKDRGFLLLGATNQPDVGRGTQRREVVEAIHQWMMHKLPLDEIYVCYEDSEDAPGRKPNPGLLLEAAQKYGIDLKASYMIGDRWRDVGAGQKAGCKTVFLYYGYAEKLPDPSADFTTDNFTTAVEWILSQEQEGNKQ